MDFIVWVFFVYGLTFLLADARIFGCDTTQFVQVMKQFEGLPIEEWWPEVKGVGILPIRQHLLKIKFFRELLSCYFCTGTWVGIVSHLLFYFFFQDHYFLHHPNAYPCWISGFAVSAIATGSVTFLVGRVIDKLE